MPQSGSFSPFVLIDLQINPLSLNSFFFSFYSEIKIQPFLVARDEVWKVGSIMFKVLVLWGSHHFALQTQGYSQTEDAV